MDYFTTPNKPALPPPPIDEIAAEVIRDLTQSFHLNTESWWYGWLRKMLMVPVTKVAGLMQSVDLKVATQSLWEAARDLLPRFSGGWEVEGDRHFPKEGPLLVVANHPGVMDAVAALAVLERPDVHLVANARPTLEVLPNTSEHMVYLNKNTPARMTTLRNLIRLLEEGSTVVLFPRGGIEPEPALYPGALESVKHWSESLGLFLSRVPETTLQLVLTQNVLTRQAWAHPLTKFGKTPGQKHEIGMVLQLIVQALFDKWKIPIKMTLPEPVSTEQLDPSLEPYALNAAVKRYVGDEMEKTFVNL